MYHQGTFLNLDHLLNRLTTLNRHRPFHPRRNTVIHEYAYVTVDVDESAAFEDPLPYDVSLEVAETTATLTPSPMR